MKVSRTMAYAINALLELALSEPGHPVPCHDIATSKRLPERFLLSILRRLVTQGMVRSVRGVTGGYFLNKPPDQITLLEICEIFEAPADPSSAEEMPIQLPTLLLSSLKKSHEAACRELKQVTLKDLVNATPTLKFAAPPKTSCSA